MSADEERYRRVLARDAGADGAFVFAVTTTGVYCRPSCPARRPRRANTRFFPTPVAAEAAGFRPCRRCAPQAQAEDVRVAVVRTLCDELRAQADRRPSLPALARRAGYSVAQLKRLFDQVLGLSPARYLEAVRAEALRRELVASDSVACAIYAAGYASASQVYGQGALGMPPGVFARGAPGEAIAYAISRTAFGLLALAGTARGVCAVELGDSEAALEAALRRSFPRATLTRAADSPALARWLRALEDHLARVGTNARVEWYPGTHHGFAFPQRPAYDKAAAERHWERLHALFARNLQRA